MNAQEFGQQGEERAAQYLAALGYTIVTRNYRAQRGELDIVAQDGQILVFVEVKSRRGSAHGSPAEAVTLAKQKLCIRTALHYMQQNNALEDEVRFDVVEVRFAQGTWQLSHIINAFIYEASHQ